MLFKDQLNRSISLEENPQRIISLVPSQTELLVDLGLENRLVGITKFCVHPRYLRKTMAVVGGTKQVNLDKSKALEPDLIICNKEENTKEIVANCESIAPVWVSDIATVDDSLDMILRLGSLTGVDHEARQLITTIRSQKAKFDNFMEGKTTLKVAYLIWKKPYMASGFGTFIDALLTLNCLENIISKTRYPEIDIDDLKDSDVILLSSEPYPFKQTDIDELQKLVPSKVILVDGEYFSWYGSRLQHAFKYFKKINEHLRPV